MHTLQLEMKSMLEQAAFQDCLDEALSWLGNILHF